MIEALEIDPSAFAGKNRGYAGLWKLQNLKLRVLTIRNYDAKVL